MEISVMSATQLKDAFGHYIKQPLTGEVFGKLDEIRKNMHCTHDMVQQITDKGVAHE